jgi:aquaporin Z
MPMRKYVVELIGAFFLVLTVGMTVMKTPEGVIPPLAIGSALMVMIYAGGHISGGHYNPAVTLAVWIRGKCPTSDVIPYMVAQVIGAVLAALIVIYLKGGMPKEGPPSRDPFASLLVEFLFTFALAYVVLNVATAKSTAGNSNYGLAIGFTVLTGAFAVGTISGGAFNPAVAIGISVMGLSSWINIWIYLVGCFAGGAAAGVLFKWLNPDDQ